MRWTYRRAVGITLCLLGGAALAQAQSPVNQSAYSPRVTGASSPILRVQDTIPPATTPSSPSSEGGAGGGVSSSNPGGTAPEGMRDTNPPAEEPGLGPTPLPKVGILQELLFGDDKDAPFKIAGWADMDYTYRSTGPGRNNVAPVMNRFGDEFLARQLGLWVYKPLDSKELSWGFNSLFIAGADASFLGPVAGGWANTNPRFGGQWTDLNLTAHLPILTEGGVDIKAGRQTTVLGAMGAIAWQRPLTSSDYAWYNLEEGRYTGVSATWHISKQLDWYNGIEFGGWGVFFDNSIHKYDYITQVSYWLDEAAKQTKVWATVLTGPTGRFGPGNSTTVEAGVLHNYNKYVYQIVDFQATYSRQPIFFAAPPGYIQRAYDIYTYVGVHVTPMVDVTTRLEYYKDVDGGGYPGGFGLGKNDYYEATVGINYHPTKWIEFRPEIRYDHATRAAFGSQSDRKNQLSIAADLLLKF